MKGFRLGISGDALQEGIEIKAIRQRWLTGVDEFVCKLPRGFNVPLHTIASTAAYRTRHPETRHGPAAQSEFPEPAR